MEVPADSMDVKGQALKAMDPKPMNFEKPAEVTLKCKCGLLLYQGGPPDFCAVSCPRCGQVVRIGKRPVSERGD